ncbi:MAG: MFS transporter [Candidatus Palauibacterales bacterium]|nr:MFS transporter [Candidatus Palauibacterales bacterium]
MSERKTGSVALGIVFFTVFLDLVGFGIVLPLLPFYATELGASPFQVGLIIASYSGMQFLFAPVWGALSDRYGRRPLLLVGLFGSAASYIVFGLAQSLEVLLLSRVIAGIMGANIPVAQAYIADSTTAERRARGMGLIGAAFGLGFIFGPAIGGGLSAWGFGLPGFVAAGLSLTAASAAWFWLPESLAPENRVRDGFGALSAVTGRARAAARVLRRRRLRDPIGVFFLGTMGFAGFTTIFPLFLENPLGLTALHAGGMFALVGVVSAGVQGGLIGPLVERHGERTIAAMGGTVLAVGVVAMGLAASLGATIVSLLGVGLGWGLMAPSLQSLVSRRAMANEQGEVLGVNQSASAFARVIGPVAAGWAYGALGHGLGFVAGGSLIAVAATWVWIMPARDAGAAPPQPERASE